MRRKRQMTAESYQDNGIDLPDDLKEALDSLEKSSFN